MNHVLVLYGSETGTAHDLAEQIWRDGHRFHVPVRVQSFDDYDLNDLPNERFVVFLISTAGQGEMPSNMRTNWRKMLNARIPVGWIDGLRVACFGLGDSSYQKYNFAIKKLARRLTQLGAAMAIGPIYGDDQHQLGPYGTFDEFLKNLWEYLETNNVITGMNTESPRDYPLKFTLDYDIKASTSAVEAESHDFVRVKCIENQRVTSENHFQDTRLISFDSTAHPKELAYKPGDVLMVQARNLQSTVDLALEALGYTDEQLNRQFSLIPNDPNVSKPPLWLVPEITTLRFCLSVYFDLHMIPRRSFFRSLALHSMHEQERERLEELADMNNLDEYLDYCQRPRRTVAEAMRDFSNSVRDLRPELLFELFTPIRPRAFSIASSPTAHAGRIELLVARVEYKAIRMVERRRGLCSTFLANLKGGDEVFVKIRPGTFRFSTKSSRIVIGPGTGIAPFRSLAAELDAQQSSTKTIVFFGCRSSQSDFYFSQEWPLMSNSSLVPAFSRPTDEEQKSYVQDKIREFGEMVWQILEQNDSQIFIAGRAKDMPDAVVEALKWVAKQHGAHEDADRFIEDLERRGRLQFETWD
ncbi:NADPH-dependent diflavin oxidoreductase 1 [Aphelenchoides besseyi]|nr:NADPH-dependent diflavin oxidoreductase 1 [Aphelenchoides besseyi]KAI6198958.1 NADPH-dependent diflavin oxidoreductase 1 [Aphelenchoides besseyi]